jgi:proteic killer suppression protein
VIQSFSCKETQYLAVKGKSRRWGGITATAIRKLEQLEFAKSLDDLRNPPGNRLEELRGDRKGQHSVRVNDQWRICFRWLSDGAHEVEIVDYH